VRLLVAIHDVTPAHDAAVRELWMLCAKHGVRPALFVVPNWHGMWPLTPDSTFVRWLRDRADGGAEIILHGYRHDEVGLHRRWSDQLRALGRTAGEGEFLTLQLDDARSRIMRGLELLEAVGLHPIGFVPPAWLTHPSATNVAAELGFAVSEDVSAIQLYEQHVRVASPVVRWSARGRWRPYLSSVVAATQNVIHHSALFVRLALHPQDLAHRTTSSSMNRTLAGWTAHRIQCTYSELAEASL
jgi:hypothetical protein